MQESKWEGEMGTQQSFVDASILEQVKVGRKYVEAKYGFRNHWYPVALSSEIKEQEPVALQVCGEKLLLNRIDDKVYSIKDQCVHKGVPLSRKPECYKKGTITCWYHGFTYRFADGELCGIVGVPESKVIGRRHIRTYATQEAKGVVFVFIGDEEFAVPPLAEDVPPGFLDDDLAVCGRHQEVRSNWRIGCENGFDSTHIFIHKDSVLVEDASLKLPLGLVPLDRNAFETAEQEGEPKGVYDLFSPETVKPVFEGEIEGEVVLRGAPENENILPHDISIWLPCALRVRPWPAPHLTQFEWYVPIDGKRHRYFQFLGQQCSTAQDEADFEQQFQERWVEKALIGFNNEDVWAREASEEFYADDTGWLREKLFEPDGNITQWRRLADKYNRGIQRPEHIR